MQPLDRRLALITGVTAFAGTVLAQDARAAAGPAPDVGALRDAVAARERAFADAFARRDRAAFADCVADEAVFMGGNDVPAVGRAAVMLAWEDLFKPATPPFSWHPERVEVLPSGRLAHSTGPVQRADGTVRIQYYTIWRLEEDGRWRAVFDNGYRVCKDA